MTKFVSDRRLIVEKVLSLINSEFRQDDIDGAMKTWWANIRSTGGFALTGAGIAAFERAGLEHWDFDIGPVKSATKLLLTFGKKIPVPYTVFNAKGKNTIRVYDSRIATMIALYGNAQEYIKDLDDRPKNNKNAVN